MCCNTVNYSCMAKQKGIIPLVGTIGGVNFYYLNGKPVARMAGGGFNGDAIKRKKSMQRVRENGSEFGACSRVNKMFRQALRPFYLQHKFTFFHSRLMRLFTGLKTLDTESARGARCVYKGVASPMGKAQLVKFCYTPNCIPRMVMPFTYAIDWQTYACTISKIAIANAVFIKGATHIAIQYGVLDFNFETLVFDLHMADVQLLSRSATDSSLTFVPNSLPSGTGVLMAVVGVRYYQEIAGVLYVLKSENSVGVEVLEVL